MDAAAVAFGFGLNEMPPMCSEFFRIRLAVSLTALLLTLPSPRGERGQGRWILICQSPHASLPDEISIAILRSRRYKNGIIVKA